MSSDSRLLLTPIADREEDPMRHRTARTLDRVLQTIADGATWVLFRGVGVRV